MSPDVIQFHHNVGYTSLIMQYCFGNGDQCCCVISIALVLDWWLQTTPESHFIDDTNGTIRYEFNRQCQYLYTSTLMNVVAILVSEKYQRIYPNST